MRDLSGALAVMEADVLPMEDAAKALPTAEPSGKFMDWPPVKVDR
jgi:hypothetical protein